MRVAVVGGAGTVGRHVTAELSRRGHDVRVLSRRSRRFPVDLASGAGLAAALEGCEAVVDASSSQRRARQVMVTGSQRLLAAEQKAGVGHHVCISIVGCRQAPVGYYRAKADQEQVTERGPVPWTIVRSTQFHELVGRVFAAAARFRVLPAPDLPMQPVAAAEAGRMIADVAEAYPYRGRVSVAGPQVATARELARTWLAGTGRPAAVVRVPLPGRTGEVLRHGALVPPQPDATGEVTFAGWLARQLG